VSPEEIIETAIEEKADMIGLSGLITPSLDEMVTMAQMMTSAGLSIPLLIGGATTSQLHTSLKIRPHYTGPVIYASDATKGVEAAKALMNPDHKDGFIKAVYAEYDRIEATSKGHIAPLLPLDEARKKINKVEIRQDQIREPTFLGQKVIEAQIEDLIPYIDWTFFFLAWEMKKSYPAILEDPKIGVEAKKLQKDALDMLSELSANKRLTCKGLLGFYKAWSEGDDLVLETDKGQITYYLYRQQKEGSDYRALSDYIASKDSGVTDYIGAFAVTAGLGIESLVEAYAKDQDDYKGILVKILADRLAEAFAEKLHEEVRKNYWAYAPDESLALADMLRDKYRGIRPAFGYPSLIDHSEKKTFFQMLDAQNLIGISLSENYMMIPGASVSGLYFAHPEAKYFDLYHIGEDQVADYAKRKGVSQKEAERQITTRIKYQ